MVAWSSGPSGATVQASHPTGVTQGSRRPAAIKAKPARTVSLRARWEVLAPAEVASSWGTRSISGTR